MPAQDITKGWAGLKKCLAVLEQTFGMFGSLKEVVEGLIECIEINEVNNSTLLYTASKT